MHNATLNFYHEEACDLLKFGNVINFRIKIQDWLFVSSMKFEEVWKWVFYTRSFTNSSKDGDGDRSAWVGWKRKGEIDTDGKRLDLFFFLIFLIVSKKIK